jgi:homopolymeric O-antigen transport system ATP-binding protein
VNVIEIEDLSKKYWINHERSSCDSLKEALSNYVKKGWKQLFGQNHPHQAKSPEKEEFWALRDVNLELKEGDRIALLGRNGAGKSTLLKILSRITEPTQGRIKVRGRVTSLLEVGTGFHPDLTGRENILLNGAIMGMSYREIKKKFDEIVAFADIEKFLDTPLKRYSSGMFMRLGFAIAAHLESEIMIVDEVLAVGDAQFQEKCIKKMNERSAQQTTILFVSHRVDSILALCNKGVLLDKGKVLAFEPIEECISRYMCNCPISGLNWKGDVGDEHIRITQASLRTSSSNVSFFYQGEKSYLDLEFEILKGHSELLLGFSVLNSRHHAIARSRLCDDPQSYRILKIEGCHRLSFPIDLNLFHPGEYQIQLECSLLNQKKILEGEILLKFAVYSQNKSPKHELGIEKDGISLGNQWMVVSDTL